MIQDMTAETINKKLFTYDEFATLWDVGILSEAGRFELIRGEIIEMPRPEPAHSGSVRRLNQLFALKLGESVIVGVQDTMLIDRYSAPMPDVVLLQPRDDFYESAHPGPTDVLLAVEVSHKSASYDKNVKAPLYAEAGVLEYWQLDVTKEILIVRTNPKDGEYQNVRTLHRGDLVRPLKLPDFVFTIDELLG